MAYRLATRVTPFAESFVRHDNSAHPQQLFDIMKIQAEPEVQTHGRGVVIFRGKQWCLECLVGIGAPIFELHYSSQTRFNFLNK